MVKYIPVVLVLASACLTAQTSVMTFGTGAHESPAAGFTYSENGYTMTTSGGSFNFRLDPATYPPSNSNFEDGFVETWNNAVVFTFTNDLSQTFDFTGIDIGHVLGDIGTWNFRGYNDTTQVASLSISTNNSISDYSAFAGLTSLEIQAGADAAYPSFDNVEFTLTTVPEPSTIGIVLGLIGFGTCLAAKYRLWEKS